MTEYDGEIPFDDDGGHERRMKLLSRRLDAEQREDRSSANAGRARYAAYLRSPEWKAKRAAVMKRANGRCERCRENRAAQVHHATYARAGHEDLSDLIAICRACREIEHGGAAKLNDDAARRMFGDRKW